MDRFSRTLRGALATLELIGQAGGYLIECDGDWDTSSPMGRFGRDLVLRLSQLFREQVAERWDEAQREAVSRGVHITARIPFGYKRNGNGRFHVDPQTAPHVRELFKRRAQGQSWAQLVAYLTEAGVAPQTSERWALGTVGSIVRNPVYLGEGRGGRGYVTPDAHDPIVSPAEWHAANRRKGQQPPTRGMNEGRLLTGIVHCESCGGRMVSDTTHKDGALYPIYGCRTRVSGRKACDHPATISAARLDPYVERAFLEAVDESEVVFHSDDSELEDATEALKAAGAELAAYIDAMGQQDISPQTFVAVVARLEQERDAALERLAELSVQPDLPKLGGVLGSQWPKLSLTERRQLLSQVFSRITVEPGRGTPEARVSFELQPAIAELAKRPQLSSPARLLILFPLPQDEASEGLVQSRAILFSQGAGSPAGLPLSPKPCSWGYVLLSPGRTPNLAPCLAGTLPYPATNFKRSQGFAGLGRREPEWCIADMRRWSGRRAAGSAWRPFHPLRGGRASAPVKGSLAGAAAERRARPPRRSGALGD